MRSVLVLAVIAAATFVWLTSEGLPPVVASHFGAGGAANGFTGRDVYAALMVAMVLGVPGLVGSMGLLARVLPPGLLNVPNKQHWLAPEHREATLDALAVLGAWMALAIAAFLCYVHWLVVQANTVRPPRLDEGAMYGALAALGVFAAAWLLGFYRRFGRAS